MNYTREWNVHEWGDKYQVVESEIRTTEKPGITMTGQLIIAKELTKANAQLLASAPRMAKLLEYLVNEGWNAGVTEEAREILAKAEE